VASGESRPLCAAPSETHSRAVDTLLSGKLTALLVTTFLAQGTHLKVPIEAIAAVPPVSVHGNVAKCYGGACRALCFTGSRPGLGHEKCCVCRSFPCSCLYIYDPGVADAVCASVLL